MRAARLGSIIETHDPEVLVTDRHVPYDETRGAVDPAGGGRAGRAVALVVVGVVLLAGGFVLGRITGPDTPTASTVAAGGTGTAQPSEAAMLLAQALELHQQGRVGEASTLYRQILDLEPTNQYALYNLGVVAHSVGELDEAISKYRAAIEVNPMFGSALYNLGLVYADRGDHELAVEFLQRAVDIDPESAASHFNLGTQLQELGRTAEGQAELDRAYELDPSLRP